MKPTPLDASQRDDDQPPATRGSQTRPTSRIAGTSTSQNMARPCTIMKPVTQILSPERRRSPKHHSHPIKTTTRLTDGRCVNRFLESPESARQEEDTDRQDPQKSCLGPLFPDPQAKLAANLLEPGPSSLVTRAQTRPESTSSLTISTRGSGRAKETPLSTYIFTFFQGKEETFTSPRNIKSMRKTAPLYKTYLQRGWFCSRKLIYQESVSWDQPYDGPKRAENDDRSRASTRTGNARWVEGIVFPNIIVLEIIHCFCT
ncbi:hypothetical protein TWF694_006758 [Orbilia ellipsospora]|uniref:Uncharacterized protein n=1 Tax=Orbilia ellipsospora TaxID=2528407 RepID=A0AAV9XMN6_9PEZI